VISVKRWNMVCQVMVISNRKLYTCFSLVVTLMNLSEYDRCNSYYFVSFPRFSIALQACYVMVVEHGHVVSLEYVFVWQLSMVGRNYRTVQHILSAIAERLV